MTANSGKIGKLQTPNILIFEHSKRTSDEKDPKEAKTRQKTIQQAPKIGESMMNSIHSYIEFMELFGNEAKESFDTQINDHKRKV